MVAALCSGLFIHARFWCLTCFSSIASLQRTQIIFVVGLCVSFADLPNVLLNLTVTDIVHYIHITHVQNYVKTFGFLFFFPLFHVVFVVSLLLLLRHSRIMYSLSSKIISIMHYTTITYIIYSILFYTVF